jgi:ribosomal 50S subunit-recycling heat shock protein
MKIETKFTGDKEVMARLLGFRDYARKDMRLAVKAIAQGKLEITQERVPVKSGALKATGRISVRVGEKQVTARIIYGDGDVRYAANVHEDLSAQHKNGQAKYVESVINETDFGAEVATALTLANAL